MSGRSEVTYHRATSLADARAKLRRRGARAYAGGTDLVLALRAGAPWVAGVRHLVDLKALVGLRGITQTAAGLRIGALVTAAELSSSVAVRRAAPVLAEAAANTSAPWVRARGTIAGNLLTPHPAGDLATALVAMGGRAEFVTSAGRRLVVPIDALVSGRRRVAPSAILVAVVTPLARTSAYERFGRRLAFCRATIAVAVVEQDDGVRVAVAGLTARPALLARVGSIPSDHVALLRGLVARAQARIGVRGKAGRARA